MYSTTLAQINIECKFWKINSYRLKNLVHFVNFFQTNRALKRKIT